MMSVGASNAAWLAPGCRLDRYDLLLQVAEGGMGILWLARQHGKHGFDKIVALKTIVPKLASDAGFRQMFLDEARVASRIEHPNVAQVLDLGEERGVLFLVMEWIDGESLVNLGRAVGCGTDERIPVGILSRIMVDVCAGVHAAHELTDDEGLPMGVVHRDVSPHNLLVGFRGTTKVIDFGIAKARNRMSQDTSIGLLKGKIAYMAPEQALGSGVDRRSDIWSAGASMYRFLAGRIPYSASEPLAVLRRIKEGLPPEPLPSTIPGPIRLVVERALQAEPANRFETARDMGVALQAAMRAAEIHTTREDVAAYMAENLGTVHAARAREIDHAVRESRARMRVERSVAEGAPAFAGPSRPSGFPTAVNAVSLSAVVSVDVAHVPYRAKLDSFEQLGSIDLLDSAIQGASPDEIPSADRPSIAASFRLPLGRSRLFAGPLARWMAGAGVLAAFFAGAFSWQAGTTASRPIGGSRDPESPTRSAQPLESSIVPSSDPLAIEAIPAPAPVPRTAAPVAESAHPNDARPVTPAVVPPSAAEPGSDEGVLERARRARRAGRIDEAAVLFAAAVERAPTDSEALTGLAEVDEAQGAMGKAIAHYRRAVAINPRYLPARLGLADSLWTSGQRDDARGVYRTIVDQFSPALCPDIARERAVATAATAKTAR
jgi:tetratricopeptide (TPR) repeat protein